MQKLLKMNPLAMLYHLLRNDVHNLQYDPQTQFEFHRRMAWFWIVNVIAASVVFFSAPGFWAQASVFYLVLVSLYANFATDYGAMPASHAAVRGDEIANTQQEVIEDTQPIQLPHFEVS